MAGKWRMRPNYPDGTPRPEAPTEYDPEADKRTCTTCGLDGACHVDSPLNRDHVYAPSPDPEHAVSEECICLWKQADPNCIHHGDRERAAMDRVIEAARRAMNGAGFYGDLEIAIAELDIIRAARKGGAR